ncbi:MAG: hypothetical protein ISR64_06190 [Deltaproteobacteria bacterium]|nr:hypothetical protein [Deltaproteobacteria bacterium]
MTKTTLCGIFLACLPVMGCGATGTAADNGPPDVPGDVHETGELACQPLEQGRLKPPVENPTRFGLAVFHYNLQYVAGGLIGFMPPDRDPDGVFAYDNDQLEDRIIKESFEPVLDLFLANPAFAGDMEMQGYMLEVMADRHPGVIGKMRTLVEKGQIAVQSFHWSDQLYNAHSRWSMEQSIQLNKAAFERTCLPQSPAVFTQEGQFSEGMLDLMKQQGQSIGIMKPGMFNYQYTGVPHVPLYTLRGQDVLVTRGLGGPDLGLSWYFVDDGEVAVTNKTNPYLGTVFQYYPEAGAKLAKKLQGLLDQGYFLTTVDDYVRRVKEMGVETAPLPYSLDGNWRPDDANNFFTWMGDSGLWAVDEADNEVLTSLERSRVTVQAAEAILDWAQAAELPLDDDSLGAQLDTAIADQLLGEVSDSTGWNPWRGEVQYSLDHSHKARDGAMAVIDAVIAATGEDGIMVDLAGPTVTKGAVFPENPWAQVDKAPLSGSVTAPGFDITFRWEQWTEGAPVDYDHYRMELTLDRVLPDAAELLVSFPRAGDRLIYSPAMLDEVADLDLQAVPGYDDQVNVPAANGLLGLGDGVFLVKDIRSFHLAAFFPHGEPTVYFKDMTLNAADKYVFHIHVLTGATADQALAEATRLNVTPTVIFHK